MCHALPQFDLVVLGIVSLRALQQRQTPRRMGQRFRPGVAPQGRLRGRAVVPRGTARLAGAFKLQCQLGRDFAGL
ncbi:MAG: hypothetical protein ABIR94_20700 [Rubrivivax sp.]